MSTIQKWGNSLAVRIPRSTAVQADVGEGTPVDVVAVAGEIVVRPKRQRRYRLKDLLKACKPRHPHAEVDWGLDVGGEVTD